MFCIKLNTVSIVFPVIEDAEKSLQAKIGMSYGIIRKIMDYQKKKLTIDEFNTIHSIDTKIKEDGTLVGTIHNFWKRMSKKLGCTYETNYTDLTKGV